MVPVRALALIVITVVLVGGWAAAFVMWRAAEIGEIVGPIEPRDFEQLTIVNVGTGGKYENPERLGPSTAVGLDDRVWLVDAGRGLAPALRKARIPVDQPQVVVLTHLMPENLLGLGDLLYTGLLVGRTTPVRVYGPVGTAAAIEGLRRHLGPGLAALTSALGLPVEGGEIEAIEVRGGFELEENGVLLRAADLTGGPVPALAWRFEANGRGLVVSGTGWGAEELIAFAHGADVLVHDGAYIPPTEDLEPAGVVADPERLAREAAISTPLLEVGEIATRAGVPTLMLIRLRPPPFFDLQVRSIVANEFSGTILVPEDGDEHEL
jgi:ribonuclease Z